eukprot:4192349-Pyramimonas_sp.AAC.1
MLATLGDPFTRLLRPPDAAAYQAQTDGQVTQSSFIIRPFVEQSDGQVTQSSFIIRPFVEQADG